VEESPNADENYEHSEILIIKLVDIQRAENSIITFSTALITITHIPFTIILENI
jgi:hypothetical protein